MTVVSANTSFSESLSDFSFSLYKEIDKTDNTCLSPFSITATMLLLMMGTNGLSRKQLQNAMFRNGQPDSNINQKYKALRENLISKTSDVPGMQLSIANQFFIEKSQVHRIKYSFRREARYKYRCYVGLMDFGREPYTRNIINKWIERKTGRKIKNFIPDGMLNDYTFMVVTNVIYFKGLWKSKFNAKLTRDREFWINNSTKRTASMMYKKFQVMAAEDMYLNSRVVELPYKGDNFSMVIILPNDIDGLSSVEQKLSNAEFIRLTKKLYKRETEVILPKFKIKANFDLKNLLSKMGVNEIFDPLKADFSHMVRPYDQYGELFVSHAMHESVIELNEEGSEATASTSFLISFRSATPPAFKFTADHPFLFVIRDIISGTVLFIGRYANPDTKETNGFKKPDFNMLNDDLSTNISAMGATDDYPFVRNTNKIGAKSIPSSNVAKSSGYGPMHFPKNVTSKENDTKLIVNKVTKSDSKSSESKLKSSTKSPPKDSADGVMYRPSPHLYQVQNVGKKDNQKENSVINVGARQGLSDNTTYQSTLHHDEDSKGNMSESKSSEYHKGLSSGQYNKDNVTYLLKEERGGERENAVSGYATNSSMSSANTSSDHAMANVSVPAAVDSKRSNENIAAVNNSDNKVAEKAQSEYHKLNHKEQTKTQKEDTYSYKYAIGEPLDFTSNDEKQFLETGTSENAINIPRHMNGEIREKQIPRLYENSETNVDIGEDISEIL